MIYFALCLALLSVSRSYVTFTAVSYQSLPGAALLPGLCAVCIHWSKSDLEALGAGDALHHASGCQHGLRVPFCPRLCTSD